MKISVDFQSLKDLSSIEKCREFLEILSSNNLILEKAGSHEPIRDSFSSDIFEKIWKGEQVDSDYSEAYILFRGNKYFKFMGMVIWRKGLFPTSHAVNGISLWLTISNNFDCFKLIDLGDKLFNWSEAEYGYITSDSIFQADVNRGNIYGYIDNLKWVNYFGQSYLEESEFHVPESGQKLLHGVRLVITDAPDDEKLIDPEYLNSIKKTIGAEWFWDYPQRYKRKKPKFDRSQISRRES